MTTSTPTTSTRNSLPFWMALGCFLMGLFDTWLFVLLGLEFSFRGRDATLIMALFLTITFSLFGYFWGKAITAKRAEKDAAEARRQALMDLARVQGRVAHMEKMAALGQVAASIAHEVRNPLAIIRSQIQNLIEDFSLEVAPDPEDFRIILEEIDRLSRVVEEIGQFSRPIQARMVPITSRDIVSRVSFMVSALYKDRDPAALTIVNTPSVEFTSDPDLLCQALMTLIINAVEISSHQDQVHLSLAQSQDELKFHIQDKGPGVPQQLHEQITQPFYTTKPGGTGLGLAIARSIARALGGQMLIGDSKLGGAQFSFCLPLQVQTGRQPNPAGAREQA